MWRAGQCAEERTDSDTDSDTDGGTDSDTPRVPPAGQLVAVPPAPFPTGVKRNGSNPARVRICVIRICSLKAEFDLCKKSGVNALGGKSEQRATGALAGKQAHWPWWITQGLL